MTEKTITKPNAATYQLEDIVGEVLAGRVRIPDFQREFRWQWDDVRRLFDSIVRGYPIGSLLLWSRRAKMETIKLGALTIDAPEIEEALWVVDGQQRLTSLASSLNDEGVADPRFAIAYDLSSENFTKPTEQRPHIVPLPVIFDLQRLLKWFAEHPESVQYFDKAAGVAKAIRQYTIPAYIVKQQNEEILRDIFDRMNNYGKRLTRAEVFSALHTRANGETPTQTLSDIVDHIDVKFGFGVIDEDTVLLAVLARRGADVTRDIRIEFNSDRVSREFPNETADQAYQAAEYALSHAVAFLQHDAGVPHFGFLTYRYLLVILTRFFAHHPKPNQRNRELLRRWYWRASVVGPEVFSGWTQALRTLAIHIVPNEETQSVQSLLKAVSDFPLRLSRLERFRSTTAKSRIFLCALWSLNPRSIITGDPYDQTSIAKSLEGRKTAVDIVYPILKREPEGFQASIANRCILLGDDLIEDARSWFANQPPLILQHTDWSGILESHGLNMELATYLSKGQNIEFLTRRHELLTSIVNQFVESMTESQFEDTPPLEDLDLDEEADEVNSGI